MSQTWAARTTVYQAGNKTSLWLADHSRSNNNMVPAKCANVEETSRYRAQGSALIRQNGFDQHGGRIDGMRQVSTGAPYRNLGRDDVRLKKTIKLVGEIPNAERRYVRAMLLAYCIIRETYSIAGLWPLVRLSFTPPGKQLFLYREQFFVRAPRCPIQASHGRYFIPWQHVDVRIWVRMRKVETVL